MHDCMCDVQSWFLTKIKRIKTLFRVFVPLYYYELLDNINIKIGSSVVKVVFFIDKSGCEARGI